VVLTGVIVVSIGLTMVLTRYAEYRRNKRRQDMQEK
jgi:hypothetical protein